jgi:hypothetical protein
MCGYLIMWCTNVSTVFYCVLFKCSFSARGQLWSVLLLAVPYLRVTDFNITAMNSITDLRHTLFNAFVSIADII